MSFEFRDSLLCSPSSHEITPKRGGKKFFSLIYIPSSSFTKYCFYLHFFAVLEFHQLDKNNSSLLPGKNLHSSWSPTHSLLGFFPALQRHFGPVAHCSHSADGNFCIQCDSRPFLKFQLQSEILNGSKQWVHFSRYTVLSNKVNSSICAPFPKQTPLPGHPSSICHPPVSHFSSPVATVTTSE